MQLLEFMLRDVWHFAGTTIAVTLVFFAAGQAIIEPLRRILFHREVMKRGWPENPADEHERNKHKNDKGGRDVE